MATKRTNRKAYVKGEYLPDKLVNKMLEGFFDNKKYQYTSKNNFLQCIAGIFFHQVINGNGLNHYAPLARNYWYKIYGGNYHKSVISPLIRAEIIETVDFGNRTIPDNTKQTTFGKQDGHVKIRYRINPDLLSEQYIFLPYINKGSMPFTVQEQILLDSKEFLIPEIPDLNFRISIDNDKANKWVENNAELICNDLLKRDYIYLLPDGLQIECHEYLDRGSFNVKYYSVRCAKFIAESRGKELFYFNNSFYIANVDEFLQYRIPALIYHYKYQISQVAALPIEEKQSPVTLRLYSHLTNFPSRILQFININNKTVHQLDLRTSQFLIFANLLNVYIVYGGEHLLSLFEEQKNKTYLKRLIKVLQTHQNQLPSVGVDINVRDSGESSSSDVVKFIRDVFYLDFYDVVAHQLGMKERLLAKHSLFKLLFKKTNRPDALLQKLSQLYPIVINIIAEFKKKDAKEKHEEKDDDNRESNFSVFLQAIEAELFVHNILKELRENDIPCFTRHDSIVVADGYQDKAETVAKDVFKRFGFKYNHKVEDKFWDAVDFCEFEDDPYLQWLTDEDILTTNYEAEDGFATPTADILELDEYQIEICNKLKKIGLRSDYFDFVNSEFLEDISNLPILSQSERNILYDDIVNLNAGITFLQNNTNELLRTIINGFEKQNLTDNG